MSLNANILPAFEQLGMLDELKTLSFRDHTSTIMYNNMKVIASFPRANDTDS